MSSPIHKSPKAYFQPSIKNSKNVFDEDKASKLPIYRPYDCLIDLQLRKAIGTNL